MDSIIRVSYTNKATIPTGIPYENQTPCYTVTREIPVNGNAEKVYQSELAKIKKFVDDKIKIDFELMAKFRGIEALPDWHRIDVIDEEVYPHVTEIIEPEKPLFIKYLEAHGYLGTLLDQTFKDYFDFGEWIYRDSKDTSVINQDYDELYLKGWEWLEANPIEFVAHSLTCRNDKKRFIGELDLVSKVDGVLSIDDFKKTKVLSKERKEVFFMKMAAYARNLPSGYDEPKQMRIISPYNKPVTTNDIDGYYKKFLVKREKYKQRFGV